MGILRKFSNMSRLAQAFFVFNQSVQQLQHGKHVEGLENAKKALALLRESGSLQGEEVMLGNIGYAYQRVGNYDKAIEYQEQSLQIAMAKNDSLEEARSRVNLGLTYAALGGYAKAIEYEHQALETARAINAIPEMTYALGNLGKVHYLLADYPKAIAYYEQCLEIIKTHPKRSGYAQLLFHLGGAYLALAEYDKALEYFQQALALAQERKERHLEGAVLTSLGQVYYRTLKYSKALECYEQSLVIKEELDDLQGISNVLGNLALVYNVQGDFHKAIELSQRSLAIARQINDPVVEGIALNNLGMIYIASSEYQQAESFLRDAVEIWESLRTQVGDSDAYKISIFERQVATYLLLQEALVAQQKSEEALEIAERASARAFVELLARRLSPDAIADMHVEAPTVTKIRQIAHEQQATLVRYSIIYRDVEAQGSRQSHISELLIWVIAPEGDIHFCQVDLTPLRLQQRASLDDLVLHSREALGALDRDAAVKTGTVVKDDQLMRQDLQQLHQLLIKRVADLLPTKADAHIIFVPQSFLFFVPFPALQDETGTYLIEQHTILTAPSIHALDFIRRQRHRVQVAAKDKVLVVGNPTMPKVVKELGSPPEQLPPLKGAEEEALAIAGLYGTQAITGSRATKELVVPLLSNARIIHFATHGLLDDIKGQGVPGAIALAPSQNDNGLLTAEEIFGLTLSAEMVVLSACNTGQGRLTEDGIIGLSRSLFRAGAASVIVSLWSVPDVSTALLMKEMYRALRHTPDRAQALRQAMLTTMKRYPNPVHWAAFTLMGEAD